MKSKERKPKVWTPRCPRCSMAMKKDGEFYIISTDTEGCLDVLAASDRATRFTCEYCGCSTYMEPKDCQPLPLDEIDI